MKKILFIVLVLIFNSLHASNILIPMDDAQKNHLKAYGIAYWTLQRNVEVYWLLNYRGGSFMIQHAVEVESECQIRGVSYEIIADVQASKILSDIARPEVNMDAVKLEKVPTIAVYTPDSKLPWDDAVTLVMKYAEIPYTKIYDAEIIKGDLSKYDWLHLHHEDFTGQYGKFWSSYQNAQWYQEDVRKQEQMATSLGFQKVSQMKLMVAKTIKNYVFGGGFLFAMCSATDSYDIALSAESTDICEYMFDGDPADPQANSKLDYTKTLAFKDFKVYTSPYEHAFSSIDIAQGTVPEEDDYFSLFEFSAKWDPIPTMLCQNHTNLVKGFMGQTTAFKLNQIKSSVLVMGANKTYQMARYIHGEYGNGTWTFYGGHDPEDYRHFIYDPPTDLNLHPNSAGYRLILNNILFPAAKKKKQKT